MSNTHLARNCPICDSKSKKIISRIDFELFDGHPMNGGYNVVQCNDCGFVFADTAVTQDDLDKYYTDLSKYEDKNIATGGGFTENDKNRLIETAGFLSKYINDKNSRILDLGCANGGLLKELKNKGYNHLVGIDPSSACVGITTAEVGCECYQYSIFDIPEKVGKFDVIILSHVLEHILNVRDAIAVIDKLLSPGSYVYIECPNAANYKEVIHAPLQEFNAEHINHFTEMAFQNLMGAYLFKKIVTNDKIFKIASNQDYHAVYGLFQKEGTQKLAYTIQFDKTIKDNIGEYIDKSNKILDEIKKTIATLPAELPVALLGVGQFAFKLLKTDVFQNGRRFKLFDNNRMNVGKKIKGVTIMHGNEILAEYKKEKFSIVISSLIHEMPIKKGIQNIFKENNEEPPIMIGFSHLVTQHKNNRKD